MFSAALGRPSCAQRSPKKMQLRYAYSPSFSEGWAIGVLVDCDVVVSSDEPLVTNAYVYTKKLSADSTVKVADLTSTVSMNKLTPAEISIEDRNEFLRVVGNVSITPGMFPWMSADGALSSLSVDAGDSLLAVEWNTDHSDSWVGLEALHDLLERFFGIYG